MSSDMRHTFALGCHVICWDWLTSQAVQSVGTCLLVLLIDKSASLLFFAPTCMAQRQETEDNADTANRLRRL